MHPPLPGDRPGSGPTASGRPGARDGELLAALGDANASTVPLRVYVEWGRWDLMSPHEELSFRESSREVWDLLSERGWEPTGGEVWDSSDFASWGNRTDVLLESLFPLEGEGPSPGLAGWSTGTP